MGTYFRIYNSTTERDLDPYIGNSTYYPYGSIIQCENNIGSAQVVGTKRQINLYDVLSHNDTLRIRTIKRPTEIEATDEPFAICVIPSNVLPDGAARFMALTEVQQMGCFGYCDNYTLPLIIGQNLNRNHTICYMHSESEAESHSWNSSVSLPATNSMIYSTYTVIGQPCKNYIVASQTYTGQDSRIQILNTIPAINHDVTNDLERMALRASHSNACIPGDGITRGKRYSYYDSGIGQSSYYFFTGGQYSYYVPSPWQLNGKLNKNLFTTHFTFNDTTSSIYHMSGMTNCMSIANPFSDFNGLENTYGLYRDTVTLNYKIRNTSAITLKRCFGEYTGSIPSNVLKCTSIGIENTEDWAYNCSVQGNAKSIRTIIYPGEWYIPSLGEMSFVIARFNSINYAMQSYCNMSAIDLLNPLHMYMTSTQASYTGVWCVNGYTGIAANVYKHSLTNFRAFLKYPVE